jgi:hypothetical protein
LSVLQNPRKNFWIQNNKIELLLLSWTKVANSLKKILCGLKWINQQAIMNTFSIKLYKNHMGKNTIHMNPPKVFIKLILALPLQRITKHLMHLMHQNRIEYLFLTFSWANAKGRVPLDKYFQRSTSQLKCLWQSKKSPKKR